MARHICVYRIADLERVRQQTGYEEELSLFDAPLGSESAVRIYWSEFAERIGLPLIASIYEYGFHHGIEWQGTNLQTAKAEIAILKVEWDKLYQSDPVLLADLAERADSFMKSIEMAQTYNGAVCIS